MTVDAGDLQHAVDGLVEERVDNWQRQLNVTDVTRTVLCALVASAARQSVPVTVGSHPEVIESTLERMTELVERHGRCKVDCGEGSDLCSTVETKSDRVCLHRQQLVNVQVKDSKVT